MCPSILYPLWMYCLRQIGHQLLRLGYRLRIVGREHVPNVGALLVVANHVSFHDWLFVGVALGRPARFVMHQHHFQYPILRTFLYVSRVIPIAPRKENAERLDAAFVEIDAALAAGEVVVIFPEGRMTDDGVMREFKPGLERILAARPVPVLPVAVSGLFGSFLSRKYGEPMSHWPTRFRAPVAVHIGALLDPVGLCASEVRTRIEELSRDTSSATLNA